MSRTSVLEVYACAQRIPLIGSGLFSLGFRAMAPFFLTIPARTESLEPGRVVVSMGMRPWTRNHIGTVHAIALCNLAEFAMGQVAEATVPATHRWIPKAMNVRYLAKAKGRLTATGTLHLPADLSGGQDAVVAISVTDPAGKAVGTVEITIWISSV